MHVGFPTGSRARIYGLCLLVLHDLKLAPEWSCKTENCLFAQVAPRHRLFFQPGWLFGLSFCRTSPRAGRRLPHRRCAVMFTSQNPCQSSGCYCVVPLNLLAPPWMLWRAFWPPSSQCWFCRPRAVLVPAQGIGRATPTLALGSYPPVAFVRLLAPKRTMRRCLFDS